MTNDREQQFLAAYDAYADALYRYIYFRVPSRPRAEELLQEAFMKTWGYLSRGESVNNLRAFFYRVARNLIIDESRRKKETSLEALREDYGFDPPEKRGDNAEHKAQTAEIWGTLNRLQPEDREIVALRYADNLEPREIAEVLEITPNAASVRLYRAMESLKRIVNP